MVTLSSEAKERINHIISESVRLKKTPGLVFGATSAGGELYSTQAGPRVIDDPASGSIDFENSVFWICSQTKLITCIAALQLVEQGKIQLDTPVSQILPEFAEPVVLEGLSSTGGPKTRPARSDITLRHLLNHSSGLAYETVRNPSFSPPDSYVAPHSRDNPVSNFFNLLKHGLPTQPLRFEPGTDFAYGYSIDSIGIIVERVSGQSLEKYIKEHIFSPLGITSTSFYLTPELQANSVALSFRQGDGTLIRWTDQCRLIEKDLDKIRLHLGGIGLYSTLKDYLTLLRHILQIHAGRAANPILGVDSVRSFFQPTLPAVAANTLNDFLQGTDFQWSTGLCVNTTDWPGRRRKESGWWYGWAGTYYFVDPETGIAVVFGTQVAPANDPEMKRLWAELEQAFYAGLQA